MATLYRKVYPERRRTTWKWKNKKENQQLAYRLSLSFLTERPAGPTLDAVIPVHPRASNPQLKITPCRSSPIGVIRVVLPRPWLVSKLYHDRGGRGPWLLKCGWTERTPWNFFWTSIPEASEPLELTLLACCGV